MSIGPKTDHWEMPQVTMVKADDLELWFVLTMEIQFEPKKHSAIKAAWETFE